MSARAFQFLAAVVVAGVISPGRAAGTGVDASKLPPAATNRIEFLRDIKPILDGHCLKCHGPEKPKSGYRIDSRESILKAGEGGTNIVVGQSARSPLIHYVAWLVEDMEMPPPGKGERLSTNQISLLRAWIDQGVAWPATEPPPKEQFSITPAVSGFTVKGDEGKFREHHWFKEGLRPGLDDFRLVEQLDARTTQTISTRVREGDWRVIVSLDRKDVGFARVGWDQFRRYYDDTGGYYGRFNPPAYSLDQDLHLDVGRAWFEAGLTRPGLPLITVGYEYHYREGDKAITQWLTETQRVANVLMIRNIYPNAKQVDERRHLFRVDADHTLGGVRVTDNFRYEFYDLDTRRAGQTEADITRTRLVDAREGQNHDQWSNALRLEKQPRDWLYLSAGYLYTELEGEASIELNTFDPSGLPARGYFWRGDEILLEQSTHTANFNTQLGPWQGFTLGAGVQTEWAHQEGFGNAIVDAGQDAITTNGVPVVLGADLDRFSIEENAVLRCTLVPRTVLFAEARLQQETIGQYEQQDDGPREFFRDTDAKNLWQDYRVGFQLSPWRPLSFGGHYRRRYRDSEYDHDLDTPTNGYPAFILSRDTTGEEVEGKVTWHTASWLKTTFTYKLQASDYRTETAPTFVIPARLATPGGTIHGGNQDAHTYGVNLTLTPWRRLYLSSTLSWQQARIVTQETNVPAIAPYKGDHYTVINSATYVLNEKTDLRLSYTFASADYDQNNEAAGLPLGLTYHQHGLEAGLSRQITHACRVNLQYAWYHYDERNTGSLNDYTAHGFFASMNLRWP